MIVFVYAQELDGGIGYQNQLPWRLPNDLAFFKKTTMGYPIVMGRKTFDSMNQKPLPGRKNIILTRNQSYQIENKEVKIVNDINAVLSIAEHETVMVIGGAEIFKVLFPYADQIIRTQIMAHITSDTFMPDIDLNIWELTNVEEGTIDEKNTLKHQFEWWKRKELTAND